jgi:hypothetical protein
VSECHGSFVTDTILKKELFGEFSAELLAYYFRCIAVAKLVVTAGI